ncbi:polysaccharide biosynthesis/export family protein [Chitinophaga sp. GCM10012297]|uniref:Polysaccharide biosynthesis/export family protein n=1 Tax=Chitinophaga chungangae TaxID=2821488 RepID=A0ABS3YBK7_9BACT|nr:polysaccharide biosynthesis/export family protein [Chitinophaga chungangae]MBO9152054.1 polysaccharide biosynthesis/export family protein [Chitinophaga chungangae]
MTERPKPYFRTTLTLALVGCLFASCVNTKKAAYFNNLNDTTLTAIKADLEPVIQKNDILQINVSAMNPQEAMMYNLPNTYSPGAAASQLPGNIAVQPGTGNPVAGYLVNQQGSIDFPVLGTINVEGLTKAALTDTIRRQLVDRKLLVDPVVSIRFLNYRVTVLGEVARPTVVNVSSEKISILEALGMAGDITIYGKKENVLLIREQDGTRTTRRLNLNDAATLSSPYFYLKPNDIVYVEPSKSKVATTGKANTIIPIVLSALGLVVILVDRLVVNN